MALNWLPAPSSQKTVSDELLTTDEEENEIILKSELLACFFQDFLIIEILMQTGKYSQAQFYPVFFQLCLSCTSIVGHLVNL